jgi:hypothetical protein
VWKRILPAAGAALAALALLFFLLAGEELFLCRTCGAERIVRTRSLTGGVLRERVSESPVSTFARDRFQAPHEHRWTSRDEFEKRGPWVFRPLDDRAQASAISIASRFDRYRPGLGPLFLKSWLNPEDPSESPFKTNYLNLLVVNENRILRTPADEHMTLERYAPLLVLPRIDPAEETKLKIWVQMQMERP